MTRRIARIDDNQPVIVKALRDIGATVESLASLGKGCPDLLVGYLGKTYLFEVKSQFGTLTADERRWHDNWRGQRVEIIRTVDQALQAVGWWDK